MTEVSFATWAELDERQRDDLARLHVELLPWTINSRIGVDHVRRIYDVTGTRDDTLVLAALAGGRVVGSASFADDHTRLEGDLARRFRGPIIRFLITHPTPTTAAVVVDSLQVQRAVKSVDSPYRFLLTWFVDPKSRGLSVGRRLLAEGRARHAADAALPLVLDVNNEAESGLAAYKRLGFVALARTTRSQILILKNWENVATS